MPHEVIIQHPSCSRLFTEVPLDCTVSAFLPDNRWQMADDRWHPVTSMRRDGTRAMKRTVRRIVAPHAFSPHCGRVFSPADGGRRGVRPARAGTPGWHRRARRGERRARARAGEEGARRRTYGARTRGMMTYNSGAIIEEVSHVLASEDSSL